MDMHVFQVESNKVLPQQGSIPYILPFHERLPLYKSSRASYRA